MEQDDTHIKEEETQEGQQDYINEGGTERMESEETVFGAEITENPPDEQITPKAQKRKLSSTSSKSKKQKIMDLSTKNPISALNELRSGLIYQLLGQEGPSHLPLFRIAVEVDGQKHIGVGPSKKVAKGRAALMALKSFIQLPVCDSSIPNQTNADFTSDSFEVPEAKKNPASTTSSPMKGSVMMLNELRPNLQYICEVNESNIFGRFKISVSVDGQKFFGVGSSKKFAKNAAAKSALNKILNIKSDPQDNDNVSSNGEFQGGKIIKPEEQELADHIGMLVNDKFIELMKNDVPHSKRKVLAGIVMVKHNDINDAEVICVTTGTKCVSGSHMSLNGLSLNDMHAEIVARRCLVTYLFDELEKNASDEKSIFIPLQNGNGYKLRDEIDFHLYINTAPCGDARIFCPHEEIESIDKHPNRISRGVLRTKIESGEGTIPVKSEKVIQTWDGVIQGDRLLTMSCSDKVCKWNVVGVQGALLSRFIEPIYLKSVILGSLYHETHLYRAICGRVEDTLQGLPPPYRLNRPAMYLISSTEARYPGKAPNFSVNWAVNNDSVEIINTTTGKLESSGTNHSRLCKKAMMTRFMKLAPRLRTLSGHSNKITQVYLDAKESVAGYRVAKEMLFRAFAKANLGNWVSKPMEQEMFEIVDFSDGLIST